VHFKFIKECTSKEDASKHIIHNIKHTSTGLPLPKNRKWKESHCPSAIPLIKAKSKITPLELYFKTRPLISQFKHPLVSSLRLTARSIRILHRKWRDSDLHHGFEMPNMSDLTDIVTKARHTLITPTPNTSPPLITIEEWDIEDMFNNIPTKQALKDLARLIKVVKSTTTNNPRLKIFAHIHHSDKTLDHISTSQSIPGYTTMTMDQIYEIAKYDFTQNKLFRLGNCVIQQNKGTAQGGYLSSELACLYVDSREHFAHKNNDLLRTSIFTRYRDNLLIFSKSSDPIWHKTKNKLTNIYKMPICIENHISTPPKQPPTYIPNFTESFTTLDSTIQLSPDSEIILTMKNAELNITTLKKFTGLRKCITKDSAHSLPIYELTWTAYFHKSMQLAIPHTYRHTNLLNLTLNAYRHGCTIDWIKRQLRSSLNSTSTKYNINRKSIQSLYFSTLRDFYSMMPITHNPTFWHSHLRPHNTPITPNHRD